MSGGEIGGKTVRGWTEVKGQCECNGVFWEEVKKVVLYRAGCVGGCWVEAKLVYSSFLLPLPNHILTRPFFVLNNKAEIEYNSICSTFFYNIEKRNLWKQLFFQALTMNNECTP